MIQCKCNTVCLPVYCVEDESICAGFSLDLCVSDGETWPPLHAAVFLLCSTGSGIIWRAG